MRVLLIVSILIYATLVEAYKPEGKTDEKKKTRIKRLDEPLKPATPATPAEQKKPSVLAAKVNDIQVKRLAKKKQAELTTGITKASGAGVTTVPSSSSEPHNQTRVKASINLPFSFVAK